MTDKSHRRSLPILPASLLAALLFALPANAQQEYFEGSITQVDREGKRIWLHEGKPLQGPCRIAFMDIDLAARYLLADFRDGIRSDTVSYFSAPSNRLLRTVIRLGRNERRIFEYDRYDGTCLVEWREADGRREGLCTEWYAEGKPRRQQEFKAGKLDGMSREWDEAGRLVSERTYRDDRLDGRAASWRYESPESGEIEVAYHEQSDHPYLIERYSFWREERGLIERIIPDSDGGTLYRARKPDCDSTRIDTLCGARMIVEIRDYREGSIRSLERYDAFTGSLVPHGVFELYAPDGRIGSRMLYEDGELIVSRDYGDTQPRGDILTTLLSREEGDRLLAATCDSKYLNACDESRPLRIRNRAGEVIFERAEEDRRYEYHGYDPDLKLHVGFSSIGSWDDVCWYVVYESDDAESVLELHEELFAVNGTTGAIASGVSYFEGEQDVSIYRRIEDEEAGSFFYLIFWITLPQVPEPVWDMHWIDNDSLLLVMEKSCLRVDIAPESLVRQEEESDEW